MVIPGLKGMSLTRFGRAVARSVARDNVTDLAAQLAYWSILALFPFAIFLVTLIGYLPIHGLSDEIFRILDSFMPRQSSSMFQSTVMGLVTQKRGWLLALSLVGSVYSASSGLASLMTSLDRAYGVAETRSYIRRKATAMALTIACAVFIIVASAALILGPDFGRSVSHFFHLGGTFDYVWRWVRWPATVLGMTSGLAFLYWACPDVKQKFKYITPGSVIGVLLWIGVSILFNVYASTLGHYNKTYGALAGAIVLLTWVYLSSLIVILGGVMNGIIWCASHPELAEHVACDTGEKGKEPKIERRPPGGGEPVPVS